MKPKVVTKTYLRNNLASITKSVVQDSNNPVWIMDDGEVATVLVDANRYDELEKENRKLKNDLFIKETLESIEEMKRGEFKEVSSVDELMKELEKDEF